MRAARPAHQAEAPHERSERDDDDFAFGELFDALRSRLVPSVGTTDAHAEKATIDGPRLDAARARALGLREGDPILLTKRPLHFPEARDALFATLYSRTDRLVFSQTLAAPTGATPDGAIRHG